MFFKTKYKKIIAQLSLLVLGLTGVFSFCLTHEALAHPGHVDTNHSVAVSELHDNHCGSDVTIDKLAPSKDSTIQPLHSYVPVIAFLGTAMPDAALVGPLSPLALPRGKPPSLQPAHLQVFRC